MTIHVTIGEAEQRLAELVAAAVSGEEVVLDVAGAPSVRLVPLEVRQDSRDAAMSKEQLAEKRRRAIGAWRDAFTGHDTSLEALKSDRVDADVRFGRAIGSAG